MFHIIVQFHSEKNDFIPREALVTQWAKSALRHKVRRGELTIRFVAKKEIRALNKRYRHQDKATNVLSFKADLPPGMSRKVPLLGDIIICPTVVNAEARKLIQAGAGDQEAHWAHIVIHGVLHILGYDHQTEREAHQMENKEIRLLHRLGFENPYL